MTCALHPLRIHRVSLAGKLMLWMQIKSPSSASDRHLSNSVFSKIESISLGLKLGVQSSSVLLQILMRLSDRVMHLRLEGQKWGKVQKKERRKWKVSSRERNDKTNWRMPWGSYTSLRGGELINLSAGVKEKTSKYCTTDPRQHWAGRGGGRYNIYRKRGKLQNIMRGKEQVHDNQWQRSQCLGCRSIAAGAEMMGCRENIQNICVV